MTKHTASFLGALALMFTVLSLPARALDADAKTPQDEYERGIDAVVRHKNFYKAGRFEFGPTAGIMPYDSLINHYMVGGRLTWHLTDHYGWEVMDAQLTMPSITDYTLGLVKEKGISNLQTQRLKMLFSSNFLLSPLYGKIRLFGKGILYFDTYFVVGVGMANNDTVKVSTTATGVNATETTLRNGFDPMLTFGLGFRMFLNDALALTFDMRDYLVNSQIYNARAFKSNYSVFLGVSFFLPTFG